MTQDMAPEDIDLCIESMQSGTHGVKVHRHSTTHARVTLERVPWVSATPERTWVTKHQNAELLVAAGAADQRTKQ